LHGIVLIDEVDTYLHPQVQYRILLVLMQQFPNFQFIVTTHSAVMLTYLEDKNNQISTYRLSPNTQLELFQHSYGGTTGETLYNYFDISGRPKEIDQLIQRIYMYAEQ
jgi:predicted ATP-binding protein involved in virulence